MAQEKRNYYTVRGIASSDMSVANRMHLQHDSNQPVIIDSNMDHTNHQCICGKSLTKILDGTKLYGNLGGMCDVCHVFRQRHQMYWHCDAGANSIHTSGYDVCDMCVDYHDKACTTSDNKCTNVLYSANIQICDDDVSRCPHLLVLPSALNNENTAQNTRTVLDHYLHLLHKHNSDGEYESITNLLSHCDISKCKSFQRIYRKTSDDDELCRSVDDQIIDKIHCFYCHSFDIGYRLRSSEKQYLRNTINDQKHNDDDAFNTTYLVNTKSVQIEKILKQKRTEHTNNNELNHRMNSKYYQLFDRNVNDNQTNNRKYGLGIQFEYGYYSERIMPNKRYSQERYSHCSEQPKYNNPDTIFPPVAPKYASLKQELTMNGISNITMQQFNDEYTKALLHYNSDFCKQTFVPFTDIDNTKWTFLSQHVLSMSIYCNYTELQYQFSKTYRENAANHDQFYYLGLYLKIAIQIFGTEIKNGNIKVFYHGISQKLVFPAYVGTFLYPYDGGLTINCPLSTSSSFVVASRFANNNNGLIVEFEDTKLWTHSTKYFSVSWLSDYGYESEHLFIQNNWPLKITNIYDTQLGFEYKHILEALRIISGITGNYQTATDDITKTMKTLLIQIVNHQLSYKKLNGICEYAQELITVYFGNQKEISIDYKIIKSKKYRFLFDVLCHLDHACIRLKTLTVMFPNAVHIRIANTISMMSCEDILTTFYNDFKTKRINSKLRKIEIILLNENSNVKIQDVILKHKIRFANIGLNISLLIW
eukprot:56397_1